MAVFPIGMALLPVFLVFRFQSAHPSWFLFHCALPKIIQIYQILGFAGVCGFFAGVLRIVAGVLRAILGAVMCIYTALVLGYEKWPGMSVGRSQDASHAQSY